MRDDVRTRLIDAAQVELAEHGRVSARVSRIARHAHVTTGAIYSNFESREELLAEASAQSMRERSRAKYSFRHMAPLVFRDGAPDFDAFYDSLGLLCSPPGEATRLMSLEALLAASYSRIGRELVYPIAEQSVRDLAGLVEQSQRAGFTRNDIDPLAIAANWIAAAIGSAAVESLVREPHDSEVHQATRRTLFCLCTSFCVSRPPAPWGSELAQLQLPPAQEPPRDADLTPSALALVESAKRALWEEGNVEFSVARVAAGAGLTTGALYSQFGSREGLIAAAYLSRLRGSLEADSGPLAAATAIFTSEVLDPERIVDMLLAFRDVATRDRRIGILEATVEASHNEALRTPMRASTAHLAGLIAPIVATAQEGGHVRDDLDPVAIAATWLGSTLGLTSFTGLFPDMREDDFVVDMSNAFLVTLNACRVEPWTRTLTPAEIGKLVLG